MHLIFLLIKKKKKEGKQREQGIGMRMDKERTDQWNEKKWKKKKKCIGIVEERSCRKVVLEKESKQRERESRSDGKEYER